MSAAAATPSSPTPDSASPTPVVDCLSCLKPNCPGCHAFKLCFSHNGRYLASFEVDVGFESKRFVVRDGITGAVIAVPKLPADDFEGCFFMNAPLCFSPDDKYCVIALYRKEEDDTTTTTTSGDDDDEDHSAAAAANGKITKGWKIVVYSTATWEPVIIAPDQEVHAASIDCLCVSDTCIVTGCQDLTAVLWKNQTAGNNSKDDTDDNGGRRSSSSILTVKPAVSFSHSDEVYDVAFNQKGDKFFTASGDGKISVFDVVSEKRLFCIHDAHGTFIRRAVWCCAGTRILSLCEDRDLKCHDVQQGLKAIAKKRLDDDDDNEKDQDQEHKSIPSHSCIVFDKRLTPSCSTTCLAVTSALKPNPVDSLIIVGSERIEPKTGSTTSSTSNNNNTAATTTDHFFHLLRLTNAESIDFRVDTSNARIESSAISNSSDNNDNNSGSCGATNVVPKPVFGNMCEMAVSPVAILLPAPTTSGGGVLLAGSCCDSQRLFMFKMPEYGRFASCVRKVWLIREKTNSPSWEKCFGVYNVAVLVSLYLPVELGY